MVKMKKSRRKTHKAIRAAQPLGTVSPGLETTGIPSTMPHGFQSWYRLPAELQLHIMTYVLAEEEPVQLFVGRA
jgi:hypothetical protein